MRSIGVKIIGPINAPNEIGEFVRGAALGFSKLGIETCIGGLAQKDEASAVYDKDTAQRLNIILQTKPTVPYVAIHINRIEAINFIDNEAIANIAWIAPMYDKIPFLHSLFLQAMPFNEIWTPSKNQASAIKTALNLKQTKVEVVPFGFEACIFSPSVPKLEGVKKDGHFYFSHTGNLIPEYGLDILLDSFYTEFSKEENVHLLWKPVMNMIKPEDRNKIAGDILNKHKGASKASVICFTEDQHNVFMASFFATSDCCIAPYRACAWGDEGLKALGCGSNLITNLNTFNSYATHVNSISLPSSRNKIADINWIMANPIYQDCGWFEISQDNLRKAMRQAYTTPNTKSLSASIIKEYDWSNVLMGAISNIRKYGEKK